MFIYLWYNALFWHHLSKEKDINKKYVIIYHNNIIIHQCIMYTVQDLLASYSVHITLGFWYKYMNILSITYHIGTIRKSKIILRRLTFQVPVQFFSGNKK